MSQCVDCRHFNDETCKCTADGKLAGIVLNEALAECEHDCDKYKEAKYQLTPEGILMSVLSEWDIELSMNDIKAIFNEFMECMESNGYIKKSNN